MDESLLGNERPKTLMENIRYQLWLFALCFALFGVQFVYSVEFAVGTPLFSSKLKLSDSTTTVIMATFGPVSGFFVQPIVGVLSDRCTHRWGRRRPFILGGALTTGIGMGLVGNAANLGELMGDNGDGDSPTDHIVGLIIAIFGFALMNVAINVTQGPARAIIADLVEPEKQQMGNAMVSCVMGLSAVGGNIFGAQLFDTDDPYLYIFNIGIAIVLGSALPTMFVAKEVPFVDSSYDQKGGIVEVFKKIYQSFKTMPKEMIPTFWIFFLSWCSYSPLMFNLTNWFGQIVYGGDPDDDDDDTYDNGVKEGMYSLAVFSGVSFFYSLALPYIISFLGIKPSYFISQLVATIAYFLFFFWADYFDYQGIAFVLVAATALNFATFNSIPYAIVSDIVGGRDAGLYMGSLNAGAVVAQSVSGQIAAIVLIFGDLSDAIAVGAIFGLMACIYVWWVIVPEPEVVEGKVNVSSVNRRSGRIDSPMSSPVSTKGSIQD